MPRRRPTLAAYARRRWRAIGAIVVLLLGSLLVLAVTDRGHDPLWTTRVPEIDQAALSPDGSAAYVLVREGENVSSVDAMRTDNGQLRWTGPLHSPRAVLAAGPNGVAVATGFPLAFLTVYNADGSPRWQVPLQGDPVAMALEGERLALALNAPANPVLFFDGDLLIRTYHLASPVRALAMESGLVATGGLQGDVMVFKDREAILNVTLPMAIRSLRLSHDGAELVAGGYGFGPTDTQGHVAFLDVGASKPVRWVADTPVGVGLVDLDADGLLAMAVEEAPPTATVHVYEGSSGATRWTRLMQGSIARADSGSQGGAAFAPDGSGVVVGTVRGNVMLLDGADGRERWSYRAGGTGVVAFAHDDAQRVLVGARLLENRPFDSVFLFDQHREPAREDAPVIAAIIAALGAIALLLVVGVGFWRVRRVY